MVCSKCDKEKHALDFRRVDYHICKDCEREARKQRYAHDPDETRDYFLRSRYGISLEEYRRLEKKQQQVCAICQKTCNKFPTLSVDHDHQTGAVRGLLCDSCNHGLGGFKDSLTNLEAAIQYLKQAPKSSTLSQFFNQY